LPSVIGRARMVGLDGQHGMIQVPRSLTMTMLAALVALSASAPLAVAEDCRAFPPGPDRRACVRREHPEQFQAKLEHCKQLASERGFTGGGGSKRPGGMKDFVQACVQGRQR
jgi:hypothetical protein